MSSYYELKKNFLSILRIIYLISKNNFKLFWHIFIELLRIISFCYMGVIFDQKGLKHPKKNSSSHCFFFCRLLNQRQLRIRSRRLRRPVARSQRRSGQRERTAISSTMPSSSTSRRMTSS